MLLSELGQRIRQQRERLGLKQHDIAHALQVSPQAVSKWERGENGPDIATLPSLSKLLGVSTDWLLGAYGEDQDVFDATVFTSTVFGAYQKSRDTHAREFAAWANGFLHQITEAVLHNDGVPIKYMGDAFLGFFSGVDHQTRAANAAFLAQRTSSEDLIIGLSSGEIYLGTMGHPDYAHADITGETVNIAFLTRNWAESELKCGVATTTTVANHLSEDYQILPKADVNFQGIAHPVHICEIKQK